MADSGVRGKQVIGPLAEEKEGLARQALDQQTPGIGAAGLHVVIRVDKEEE